MTATPAINAFSPVGLRPLDVREQPFDHVIARNFLPAAMFDELSRSFPECPPSSGPTGFSLYWGDPEYDQLVSSSEAWAALFATFQSQRFIDWAALQFSAVWAKEGCLIDPSMARFVSYREDRTDKERRNLRRVLHEPEELWVRMDIHQGRVGYARRRHLDHARRLISLLLYFSDRDECGMVGGDLLLHRSGLARWLPPVARVTPRRNLMIAFPCSNRSYHSVSSILSMMHPRNYLQVHISSSVDIWPRSGF